MKIIIVGCGKIGTAMLSNLVNEGHEVLAIDSDPATITELTNIYDVMCICGNGADSDVLKEAGVQDAEMFAAVTASDELNMLACFFAKKMGAKHTIARIRNPEYNDGSLAFMRQQIELSMSINPERLCAHELFNILKLPGAMSIETFSRRSFEMIELKLRENSAFAGKSLMELRQKYKAKFLICVVRRGDEVYIPDGNFVLQSGDRIGMAATASEGEKLFKMLGLMRKRTKNVMIVGANRTSYYLAKMLINIGSNVKVIDKDRDRCVTFSEQIPDAVVINGDPASREVLMEEGLANMDSFVSLTGMDEENVLLSIFASSKNVPQIITKINRPELCQMALNLGLDSIVSPRKIISDRLCQYARALEMSIGAERETLYTLMDEKAEALEFIVRNDFEFLDIPLKDLHLKHNTLIAGIIRGRRTIIPSGTDVILPDDRVIVIAAGRRITSLGDVFE